MSPRALRNVGATMVYVVLGGAANRHRWSRPTLVHFLRESAGPPTHQEKEATMYEFNLEFSTLLLTIPVAIWGIAAYAMQFVGR